MRYWWVNHKQTADAEVAGGYIWSPKTNRAGRDVWSYTNLTETNIGDVIFSYAGGKISAVGVVVGRCREEERPEEFGVIGNAWNDSGWFVPVEWTKLSKVVKPKHHLADIKPLLPSKYSPIRPDGGGNQGCYLARIPDNLGSVLIELSDSAKTTLERSLLIQNESVVNSREAEILSDPSLAITEKEQLIRARRGQGRFRSNVESIETSCRLTGLDTKQFLIASHIKPWQLSSNAERLDGNNGLLLSPHIDKLFDRGWISFSNDGGILIADSNVAPVLAAWRVDAKRNVGTFNASQTDYLDYHRKHVFKRK